MAAPRLPPKPGQYRESPERRQQYQASPAPANLSAVDYGQNGHTYAQMPRPFDPYGGMEDDDLAPSIARYDAPPRIPSEQYSPSLGTLDTLMSDIEQHMKLTHEFASTQHDPHHPSRGRDPNTSHLPQEVPSRAALPPPRMPKPLPALNAPSDSYQAPGPQDDFTRQRLSSGYSAARPISSASAIINLYATSDSASSPIGNGGTGNTGAPWATPPRITHSAAPEQWPAGVDGHAVQDEGSSQRAARPLPPPPPAELHQGDAQRSRSNTANSRSSPAPSQSISRIRDEERTAGHLHTVSHGSSGFHSSSPSWSPEVSAVRVRGQSTRPGASSSRREAEHDGSGFYHRSPSRHNVHEPSLRRDESAASTGGTNNRETAIVATSERFMTSSNGTHGPEIPLAASAPAAPVDVGTVWELSGPEGQTEAVISPSAASHWGAQGTAPVGSRLGPYYSPSSKTAHALPALPAQSTEDLLPMSFAARPAIYEQRPSGDYQRPSGASPTPSSSHVRSESSFQTNGVTGWASSQNNPLLSTPSRGQISDDMSYGSPYNGEGLPHAPSFGSYAGPSTPLTPAAARGDSDFALLSVIAMQLRESIPKGTQVKGSIQYPYSFTGRDVVSTIQALVPREHAAWAAGLYGGRLDATSERKVALLVAKTLKSQLFFHEVDWGQNELRDGVEEVYMFLEDSLAGARTPDIREREENLFERELQRAHREGTKRGGARSGAADDLEELPTGVFTPLTACYSPLCGKPGAPPGTHCFAASCPRARSSELNTRLVAVPLADDITPPAPGELSRWGQPMQAAQSGAAGQSHLNAAWADLVPPELLASIPKKEIKRQNAILETIQKEEEFLSDLELLDGLFLFKLERPFDNGDPPAIPIGPERDNFISEVFSNHTELVAHIKRLVERLHVRQREESPVVQSIGDIFLDAALEWGGAFDTNMTNFPLAKQRIQREASVNTRFASFLEICRRDPACHRLPMDHFLQRATTRLPRYQLHFKSILADTEEANPDRESLARAIEIVDEQCRAIQKGVVEAEVRVRIRDFAYNISSKRKGGFADMDLLNPERQLVHQGRVYRKPEFQELDWVDLQAVLFDNFLIVTRAKKREEDEERSAPAAPKHILVKRPIPIEMMELSGFNEPSISRSIGLSNFNLRGGSERESRDLFPFTLHHIGGKMKPLTLYAPSRPARDVWRRKFEEAQGLRAAVQEANKVFEAHTVSDDVFALPSITAIDPEKPPPGIDTGAFHGRVTCAVPFSTPDGRHLIAVGCADGVWIGLRHDPRSLRKVLHLKVVTQCAVLESFGIFVVLADKVLISYSLEALVPSAGSTNAPRPPQKLSGNRDVVFFSVGQLKDRTLLVYMKKKANESVFRALEPVVNAPQAESGRGGGGLFSRLGRETKNTDWFRIYKTFFIPSEAYSIQFLRSKLCIVCARGFEIMSLESLQPGTIPDFSQCPRDDPLVQNLVNRVDRAKPLGMFKHSESEFLLCYDAFACYVDRLGEPVRLDHLIEWEGTPHSVAFRAPYVLAFDQRFVEVRDCSTGQLVQLIRASDLRFVSSGASPASDTESSPIILTQRRRASGRMPFDYQHVFELVSNMPTQLVRADTTMTAKTFGSGGSRASTATGWF